MNRQEFLQSTAMAGAAVLLSSLESWAITTPDKKLRVAVIGCGSVSNRYIPKLQSSSMIELVSLCDIKYERAEAQNKQYNVDAKTYRNIDEMLKGVPFDMMVTLTDMPRHTCFHFFSKPRTALAYQKRYRKRARRSARIVRGQRHGSAHRSRRRGISRVCHSRERPTVLGCHCRTSKRSGGGVAAGAATQASTCLKAQSPRGIPLQAERMGVPTTFRNSVVPT